MTGWLNKNMKKIVLSLLLSVGTIAYSNAIPKWLSEIFGCTWAWSGNAIGKGTDANGMCKYERPMSGSSWLWGSCGTTMEKYTIPCDADPNFRPVRRRTYGEADYQFIANEMVALASNNYNVDPAWTDPIQLQESNTVLNAAVAFKLSLAGYTFDPNWLTLENEPCPVPQPTNAAVIPQYYTFINADCTNNVAVYPNPNSGNFDLQINNYKDVLSLQVIRISDMSSVLSLTSNFTFNNSIKLNTVAGLHYLRIVTLTGVIYKNILIQ